MMKRVLFGLCVVIMAVAGCDSGGGSDEPTVESFTVTIRGTAVNGTNKSGTPLTSANKQKIETAFAGVPTNGTNMDTQLTLLLTKGSAFTITIEQGNGAFTKSGNYGIACGMTWLNNNVNVPAINGALNILLNSNSFASMHNPAEAVRLAGVYASGVGTAL
jgi:hypothetical protein